MHISAVRMNKARCAAAIIVVSLLPFAGVSKLFAWSTWSESPDSWALIPVALRSAVAIGVPLLELTVGFLALTLMRIRISSLFAAIVLAFVSTGYVAHLAAGYSPTCACFAEVLKGKKLENEAWTVLIRNAALLAMGLFAAFGPGAPARSTPTDAPASPSPS